MDVVNSKTWNVADHQSGFGRSLSERYAGLSADVDEASRQGLWQYFRCHQAGADIDITVTDEAGRSFRGIIVASQDYLGLARDQRVADAVVEAVRSFGVHSSGSAPMGGGSHQATMLANKVSTVLGVDHTLLFPTGWASGYGVIKGLVRPHDVAVIDALAHNCLQHGARAATPNVVVFSHNSADSLRKRVARLSRSDPDAAILIVTESLFSMDSDAPPLQEYVAIKQEFDAHLLVDIAHDFGVLGAGGKGIAHDLVDPAEVDLFVGSFSKTFASIGGFLSTNQFNLVRAVQAYGGSHSFSNFLIPPQIAAVSAAMDIAFGPSGDILRRHVLENTQLLRHRLAMLGVETTGIDSAMVIVKVGDEERARRAYRALLARGIILNCIEYPAVRIGDARFRLQLTPNHQAADVERIADEIAGVLAGVAVA